MIPRTGLRDFARDFATDCGGTTSIEYAVAAAGIAGVIIGTVNAIGTTGVAVFFNKVAAIF